MLHAYNVILIGPCAFYQTVYCKNKNPNTITTTAHTNEKHNHL